MYDKTKRPNWRALFGTRATALLNVCILALVSIVYLQQQQILQMVFGTIPPGYHSESVVIPAISAFVIRNRFYSLFQLLAHGFIAWEQFDNISNNRGYLVSFEVAGLMVVSILSLIAFGIWLALRAIGQKTTG